MKRYIHTAEYRNQYLYYGPIYVNDRVFVNAVSLQTLAVSKQRAIQNFIYQIKKNSEFNKLIRTYDKVSIDESRIKDVTTPPDAIASPRCSRCGRQLNDSGECLDCDLGVEDLED